jgi:Pyruvate/2-oxoacid:ferredoxin oxidoreductase delta subunit
MSKGEHIHVLADRIGKGDSPAMHKILDCAVTEEEARLLADLPAPAADLATRHGMAEHAVEAKIMNLARRGLVVSSRKGMRFPGDPATLHDTILSSSPELIPAGIDKLWMELYDGEGWANEIGNALAGLPMPVLRTIPIQGSVPSDATLAPHESIVEIIEAHKDLITIRNCCCRTGAKKCDHPVQVCMQFAGRAEYDLYRRSGRKVTADEAIAIAATAGSSGLVPTVSNTSKIDALDFICFCCGCCCLVINPGLRVGGLLNILAPSRFVSSIDAETCNGCAECVERCCVGAIAAGVVDGPVVVDRDKCLGCGACVLACPFEGGITMQLVRPPAFIPETDFGPSSILHM